MTAKQYLNRGYYIDLRIKHLEEQLEKTQNSLLSVQKYNSIKVQTSKKNSTEELHIKLLSYKEELNKKLDKLYDTKQEILEVINKIDDNRYREVLTARYISFQKFKKIAKCMNYDERHIYRIHHAALNEAEKFINKK